jgi:hypothetical protein
MKYRINYSDIEKLYQIETKSIFGKWETRKCYLFTNPEGNVVRSKGFFTYEFAEEWMHDRYPKINNSNDSGKNKNMGFEF